MGKEYEFVTVSSAWAIPSALKGDPLALLTRIAAALIPPHLGRSDGRLDAIIDPPGAIARLLGIPLEDVVAALERATVKAPDCIQWDGGNLHLLDFETGPAKYLLGNRARQQKHSQGSGGTPKGRRPPGAPPGPRGRKRSGTDPLDERIAVAFETAYTQRNNGSPPPPRGHWHKSIADCRQWLRERFSGETDDAIVSHLEAGLASVQRFTTGLTYLHRDIASIVNGNGKASNGGQRRGGGLGPMVGRDLQDDEVQP